MRTQQTGRGAFEGADLEFLSLVQAIRLGIQKLKEGTIDFVGEDLPIDQNWGGYVVFCGEFTQDLSLIPSPRKAAFPRP